MGKKSAKFSEARERMREVARARSANSLAASVLVVTCATGLANASNPDEIAVLAHDEAAAPQRITEQPPLSDAHDFELTTKHENAFTRFSNGFVQHPA